MALTPFRRERDSLGRCSAWRRFGVLIIPEKSEIRSFWRKNSDRILPLVHFLSTHLKSESPSGWKILMVLSSRKIFFHFLESVFGSTGNSSGESENKLSTTIGISLKLNSQVHLIGYLLVWAKSGDIWNYYKFSLFICKKLQSKISWLIL